MAFRTFTQCAGGTFQKNSTDCKLRKTFGNPYSPPVPGTVWTIIKFPERIHQGGGSMARNRKRHALIVGCVVFGMVVCGGAARIAAQSRASEFADASIPSVARRPAVRVDVERFRQRAEAA